MISARNKPFNGNDKNYRGLVTNQPWSLCVGAGISIGLVPTWQELTRRIVNEVFGASYDEDGFNKLTNNTRWSFDTLLQGAANYLKLQSKPAQAFSDLLEKHLYTDLLNKAETAGVKIPIIEALNNPRLLTKEQVQSLCEYFIAAYGHSTLVSLAQRTSTAKESGSSPQSIINFNADTLLYAVLDLFLIEDHFKSSGTFEHPKLAYRKTIRGVDSGNRDVTSVFHCHGAVSPKSIKSNAIKHKDARDSLVFSESDYLKISGNVSTWAQTLFLYHAQCSRLLIIGHSMSDTNIRKWLAWSHENSMKEISKLTSSSEITPRHIWVSVEPKDKHQKLIQEASLLHIGVRVCWIRGWTDIGPVLDNLLAL